MKGARVNPARRSFALVVGFMRMSKQQVIGSCTSHPTQFAFHVAVGHRERAPGQFDYPRLPQKHPSHLGNRPMDSLLINVVVSQHEVSRQRRTFIHHFRVGQVAAMDQNLGPVIGQNPNGHRRSRSLIVGVGQDADAHDPYRWCNR